MECEACGEWHSLWMPCRGSFNVLAAIAVVVGLGSLIFLGARNELPTKLT